MAPLVFPENFRRRSIEGWAVIRYDVAPWGQTGNVRVAEAQPAAGFGDAARSIVQLSTRRPSAYGYTGCLELVRFVLPPRDARPEE
jgi:TonB family protein